ncbi:hypothetical protein DB346_09145 [Verrucomicrobia bacterium LW23]|nr:hypothetical protein DB346_09145 [Verrucomicrobia bacterium LW23]
MTTRLAPLRTFCAYAIILLLAALAPAPAFARATYDPKATSLTFYCEAGYVADIKVEWLERHSSGIDLAKSWSKRLALGKSATVRIGPNTKNLKVTFKPVGGLSKVEFFVGGTGFYSYILHGTVFNPRWKYNDKP